MNYNLKTIFISGGSTGIGFELAKLFASKGASVVIFARTKERLELAVQELSAKVINNGQKFGYRQVDVSKPNEVETVMKDAVQAFGVPDILINCAGRALPDYFENISNDQFHQTMSTNLYGMWYIIKTLVPYMKAKGGKIVNISSMCGLMGIFGYTDYCASKYAVIGFSEALRSEMKRFNIHVSVVCPPDTDTPGFATENMTKPEETKILSGNAKLMLPKDVAAEIIKGLEKGTKVIIPSADGRMTANFKRLFPNAFESFLDKQLEKYERKKAISK